MSAVKKFIFVDGVMKLNPAYGAGPAGGPAKPPPPPTEQLAVVSTMDDIMGSQEAQKLQTGKEGKLADSMVSSFEIMMDEDYLKQFHATTDLNGNALIEQLSLYFARYETPIGLLNKILALVQYKLDFILDDSGSMMCDSDVKMSEGCEHVKKNVTFDSNTLMTRWQEAEHRLHIFIDIISFVPTKGIKVSFMNSSRVLELSQDGKTPDQFKAYAHDLIHTTMTTTTRPYGGTPTYRVLSSAFNEATTSAHPIMIYFFTDGVPSDRSAEDVSKMVVNRPNPQRTPLTFLTCTDKDSEAQWMKDVRHVIFCNFICFIRCFVMYLSINVTFTAVRRPSTMGG
jgi:hypothetical protein